jgi:hypothetical protein
VRVAAVIENPGHALAGVCILQSDTRLTVAQEVGCAGHLPLSTNRGQSNSEAIGAVIKDPEYMVAGNRVL